MNVVLGGRPPPIADTEENLPRKTRVVLAQLRSGWSNRLNAYWSRIDRAVPNECPACGQGPHDTHLGLPAWLDLAGLSSFFDACPVSS